MLGLFGTLNIGARALQAQQTGVEVAGHNLANVNNPAYARQRVHLTSALPIPTPLGPQGTGVEVVSVEQLRNALLDSQLTSEISVTGFFEASQQALQFAQADLGQQIDRQASGAEGAAASAGVTGNYGLAEGLTDLFSGFQSLSVNPASMAERQVLLLKAQTLTSQFNQIDKRLGDLQNLLNDSLASDGTAANSLLSQIAQLNEQIINTEVGATGTANDLRDSRQAKLEDLAKLVKFDASAGAGGAINISIGGTLMVSGQTQLDSLATYDAGGGQRLVRAQTAGTPLTLTGGRMLGTIDARDGALASLRASVDTLAGQLISEVNTLHAAGFSLTGSTGENFFSGTGAANLGVNANLLGNPALIQASGAAGTVGDNRTALALAQLANKNIAALSSQTLTQSFSRTVADLGQAISSVNSQQSTQSVVESMLRRQRDAVSGVSLDEEMTDMVKYQRAYQASARLITTIDEMLDTVLGMKR